MTLWVILYLIVGVWCAYSFFKEKEVSLSRYYKRHRRSWRYITTVNLFWFFVIVVFWLPLGLIGLVALPFIDTDKDPFGD